MSTENPKLKPCPFCGNEKIVLLDNPLTKIYGTKVANRYCEKCQAQAPQNSWDVRVKHDRASLVSDIEAFISTYCNYDNEDQYEYMVTELKALINQDKESS